LKISTMLAFARRLLLLAFLLPIALTSGNAFADQTWTEIRSPHFRVITDGSAKDGRMVANEFEQMRYVFSKSFNNTRIESGAPLTIVAARDESTYRTIAPSLWKSRGNNIAGVFFRGWEKQFALIRLDTWGDANAVVVYHEYTHSILHANAHWLPIWLDEGLAEFYAYTRFEKDHIYVGAPSLRMGHLRGQTLVPVSTMLDITTRSPYYNDERKSQLFYAEAWAMVHYMTFGPGMENGAKLLQFFRLVEAGTNQHKAFEQIFGDPKVFDNAFSNYAGLYLFSAGKMASDPASDPKSFAERKLSPAEVDYELGCFSIGSHDRANGRTLMEKSLTLDPNLAAAHEELGFLDFVAGKDNDAKNEWKQAVKLDPSLPRSLFAVTMSGPLSVPLASLSTEQLHAGQLTLQHITQLAPRYAPAFVELSLLEWKLGLVQQAYSDAHQAEMLEPWRAGYRILTGRILLQGNKPAMAATYAQYVATHWFGPDHDEAFDLWQAIPPDKRGDGAAVAMDIPDGAETVRGRLVEVSCGNADGPAKFTVTLIPDKAADAKPLTFTGNGRLRIGFSDTLWWGEDHFTACHHLGGHPAVLVYKAQGSQGPELVDLEVRDDLPDTTSLAPPQVPSSH
jgi:tetratricopeptide (TPR) repeat protein